MREVFYFNGSSSSVEAFNKWFMGEEFHSPLISTRDCGQELILPNGSVARIGDLIEKVNDNFIIVEK